MKKIKNKILLSIYILAVIVCVISWRSARFCDWYIDNIFSVGTNTYSRFTSIFPFSVGEIMICIALILTLILIVATLLPFLHTLKKFIKVDEEKFNIIIEKFIKFRKKYAYIISWIVAVVFLEMSLNMVILYHASTFDKKYNVVDANAKPNMEDIYNLREHIVKKANEYSKKVKRDENGLIIANKDEYIKKSKEAMKNMGKTYPELSGYYPNPKKLFFSDFVSQQYILGIYFPFSLEANYNNNIYIPNIPVTICHELSHVKGFIYEDEANFIAYIACINADDDFMKYSGYLSVVYYIEETFLKNTNKEFYKKATKLDEQVKKDDTFLLPETWEKVEKGAVISTETVKDISKKATDTSLKINGVKDGEISYSRVVELLLKYYAKNDFEV